MAGRKPKPTAVKKVEGNIILCAVTAKSDFEQIQRDKGKNEKEIKKNIEGIIKGQQNALHIIKQLCSYKGVEILEGPLMPDHVHMPVSIPARVSVSSFMHICPAFCT